ncbi:tumor protein p63-regulated gene 1 protein isoform X1 [Pelodiscus sinensis]
MSPEKGRRMTDREKGVRTGLEAEDLMLRTLGLCDPRMGGNKRSPDQRAEVQEDGPPQNLIQHLERGELPRQAWPGGGAAVVAETSDSEHNLELQTVQMEETGERKAGGGNAPEANPSVGTGTPSVSSTSTLFPKLYTQQNAMRKFFVTRPGAFDQAIEDLKTHVVENSGETAQSFWLLTEIDHWNNERERVVVITDATLLVCKYDFIMLTCLQVQRIPLNYIDRICLGQFTFPERSLDKREGEGLRIYWDNLKEPSVLSRWNPWAVDIPYATFTEHPVKGSSEGFRAACQMSEFTAQLVQAVQSAQSKNPAPGKTSSVAVLNQPLLIDTYMGLVSFIGNRNKLGYSLARGNMGF